jgi:hypothetical protein
MYLLAGIHDALFVKCRRFVVAENYTAPVHDKDQAGSRMYGRRATLKADGFWFGLAWFGLAWFGLAWFGLGWFWFVGR